MKSNVFDNKEVRLTKHRISFYGRDVYSFTWWSEGRRRAFHSVESNHDEALAEFRSEYPESRGCTLLIASA